MAVFVYQGPTASGMQNGEIEAPVRQVEAGHIHPRINELADALGGGHCRAEGADDLGSTHAPTLARGGWGPTPPVGHSWGGMLGIELKVANRRLLCPDLATARYLSVFARLGCDVIAVPYDITQISRIADELESGRKPYA